MDAFRQKLRSVILRWMAHFRHCSLQVPLHAQWANAILSSKIFLATLLFASYHFEAGYVLLCVVNIYLTGRSNDGFFCSKVGIHSAELSSPRLSATFCWMYPMFYFHLRIIKTSRFASNSDFRGIRKIELGYRPKRRIFGDT